MSLIPCTSDCAFQQEGRCTLDCANIGNVLLPGGEQNACPNFHPRILSLQGGERLTDIPDLDQS